VLILWGAMAAWAAYAVLMVARRRHSPGQLTLRLAVSLVALLLGMLTMLMLGLGCFHCSGVGAYVWVIGGGVAVTAVTWLGGLGACRWATSRRT